MRRKEEPLVSPFCISRKLLWQQTALAGKCSRAAAERSLSDCVQIKEPTIWARYGGGAPLANANRTHTHSMCNPSSFNLAFSPICKRPRPLPLKSNLAGSLGRELVCIVMRARLMEAAARTTALALCAVIGCSLSLR